MKKFSLISLIGCFIVAVAVYGLAPSFLADVENRALDYRFEIRGSIAPDQRIVIVGFDQETQIWSGRPPFAMPPLFAELADAAASAGAAAFLLDITFSMVSEGFIRQHVKEIAQQSGLDLGRGFLQKLGFEKPLRSSLIRMVETKTALIAGFAWEQGQRSFYDKALERIAGADNFGYFNLVTSADRVIRDIQLHSRADNRKVYAVGALAAKLSGIQGVAIPESSLQKINFCGARQTFETISMKDLIKDHRRSGELATRLADRIVLVGFTDITDFKLTPFGYMPGVEVHANIIDNILQNRFLEPIKIQNELVAIVIIILILFALTLKRRVIGIISGMFTLFAWTTTSFYYFDPVVIPVVKPFLVLGCFVVIETIIAYRTIYLDRKRVHRVFSRYVSDSVVKEILAANEQDFLKGQRRRLCVLMGDIRGFTTFSEKHAAEDVVSFLNQYFSKLTEIIMKHRGVVDKFLGDGILAFFNAPVATDRFVDNAVAAAKDILDYTHSPEFKNICHGENLRVGVALHCGEAVFGNIGSDRKAEFTVIGDTVNACSRMEGLNKEYNTNIIVSNEVVKSADSTLKWKFLARTPLRGKKDEIELYTMAGEEEEHV